jgi:hypothetical protein
MDLTSLFLAMSTHAMAIQIMVKIPNFDDDHYLTSFSYGLYKILFLIHSHEKIHNLHRQHKFIYTMI